MITRVGKCTIDINHGIDFKIISIEFIFMGKITATVFVVYDCYNSLMQPYEIDEK